MCNTVMLGSMQTQGLKIISDPAKRTRAMGGNKIVIDTCHKASARHIVFQAPLQPSSLPTCKYTADHQLDAVIMYREHQAVL